MTDKLAARTRSLDKLLEALQLIHDRFPRLVTLLHGRDDNLIYPRSLHYLSFRKLTIEEREFIESDFRCFLSHPLNTLHHFGRSNGKMDMPLPRTFLRHILLDFIKTALAGGSCHLCTVERSFPIHEENLITTLQSQHSQRMGSLLSRQFHLVCRIRHIEISNLFHSLSIIYHQDQSFKFFSSFSSCRRFISSRIKEAPS